MGIQNAKRIVVKVGSSLVTNNGEGLDHAASPIGLNKLLACKNRAVRS
jgi:glutamate 5-kinase